jgi:hypothetical protein
MTNTNTVNALVARLAEIIPPVVAAPPAYPFVGQKAVKAVLESNDEVQALTVQLLHALQTEQEQAARDTEVRNKAGFMSSDAWHGSRIAEALNNGDELAMEDVERIPKIACKYSKQLTTQLRRHAMVQDAKLAAYAAVFSAQ